MSPMENFAHTPQVRARIVAARQECATYFWRGVASLFKRSA
jgi:hypothetical protein